MIDLAVLGLLQEHDLHGYELRKRITELLGLRGAVSFGSLYPALARLERNGAVKAVEARTPDRPVMPMTGSLKGEASAFTRRRATAAPHAGRGRKAYGITDHGRALLVELLDDPATDDDAKVFALKVAFCAALTPSRRLELFERRRAQLASRLAGTRASRSGRRTTERLDHYLRSLREHDTQSLQHDIAWLDGLIADERVPKENDQ